VTITLSWSLSESLFRSLFWSWEISSTCKPRRLTFSKRLSIWRSPHVKDQKCKVYQSQEYIIMYVFLLLPR